MSVLRPPFPYFGGKRAIAPLIWDALGDVGVYVEPFLGSAAVLLARPHAPRVETVNDASCWIANFWRAVQHDPEGVAQWADAPVSEVDLHARHRWLMAQEDFLTRMRTDPDYYDVKLAGWWVWGQGMWIGSGWCVEGYTHRAKKPDLHHWGGGIHTKQKKPDITGNRFGRGIHAKRPMVAGDRRGNGVHGFWQQKPMVAGDTPTLGLAGSRAVQAWIQALAARLRYVRVCCGDWQRVCTPVVLDGAGVTGVYLDPPYGHTERDTRLYSTDEDVSGAVAAWAMAHGDNPRLRIVLSGYEGEHAMPPTWQKLAWQTNGGYGNQGQGRGRANARREVLWMSPHCTRPQLELWS
jgi:site-specific DNA-adenine methylase